MGQNPAGRVGARHGPQQLAGVNRNTVWHPLGNAQILHGAAGIIQQDQIELFILDAAEQRLDIFNGRLCLAQRLAGDALFQGIIAAVRHDGRYQMGAFGADAIYLRQLLRLSLHNLAEITKMLDQAVCQFIGIHARDGKVQQIFQRFMLRQALQAVALHAGLHPCAVVFVRVARCHFFSSPIFTFY